MLDDARLKALAGTVALDGFDAFSRMIGFEEVWSFDRTYASADN